MGSLKNRLHMFYSNILLIEKIFIDYKLEWEFYDRIQNLKQRLKNIPKLSQKNNNLMKNELNWCISEFEDLKEMIPPHIYKQYYKESKKEK